MPNLQIGAPYSFVPAAFIGEKYNPPGPGQTRVPSRVNGRITYIHWAHRWFQVTYEVFGHTLKECFKF